MYIIDIKTLTVYGDIHRLLRDEKTKDIILFETLEQAVKWCMDNGYELYDPDFPMPNDLYYTYQYRKNMGNGTAFAYIYPCKMYE